MLDAQLSLFRIINGSGISGSGRNINSDLIHAYYCVHAVELFCETNQGFGSWEQVLSGTSSFRCLAQIPAYIGWNKGIDPDYRCRYQFTPTVPRLEVPAGSSVTINCNNARLLPCRGCAGLFRVRENATLLLSNCYIVEADVFSVRLSLLLTTHLYVMCVVVSFWPMYGVAHP